MFKVNLNQKFTQTNFPKTVRFTEDIDDELMELKKKTGVSFNEIVLQCCRYALDNMEEEQK